MKAAVHADVELAATTPHDELPVALIAQLAPELTVLNLCELASTLVLAVVVVSELLLDLNDTTPTLSWSYIWRSCSVHDLFGASDEVALDPEGATASTRCCPLGSATIAELGPAFASTSR